MVDLSPSKGVTGSPTGTAAVATPLTARQSAGSDERQDVDSVDAIPRLADAVRRKLDEAITSPIKSPDKKPLYMTLNLRGRALFDLAFIMSKVPAGSKEATKALELCDLANVAYTMVRIIENEREEGDGFAAKSAVLALSVLANLACVNGHVQLMRPEINALGLFLALLSDDEAQAQSALVLPYAIAGVRNLANQVGAAEMLRKTGGEQQLRELLARPDISEVLDEHTLVHAHKALLLVNDLAIKAPKLTNKILPGARKKVEETTERRHKELEEEHKKLVERRDAAVDIQKNVRRFQSEKNYHFAKKVEKLDDEHVGPMSSMMELIRGLRDPNLTARAKCVHALATFAASCSSLRLAELALHSDEIVAMLAAQREHPSTQAYACCIVANLSYTPNGQRAAIHAGAVEALLGVIQSHVRAEAVDDRAARNAAMSQAAAALQNLTFELTPVCDELVKRGAVGALNALMTHAESDAACHEYAAGVLTNLHVYASAPLDDEALGATQKARSLIAGKHERSESHEQEGATRIQATWRGKSVRTHVDDARRPGGGGRLGKAH
ncbi:hypothetical protein KFE25_007994 [Diacronema lutheri]|mgnify:CR=1 FL=1|uniref:Uncharacterized protein n=2 Tax=Diacronema lutheri TaxID=2081491 RepID=A0A8J5XW88_DIALT|nr:hypothetical protein KFE25_007994 [Diacronema lutheri]